jgi:hypothetical protein
MSVSRNFSCARRLSVLGCAAILCLAIPQTNAQSASASNTAGAPAFSPAAESSSLQIAKAAFPFDMPAEPAVASARATGGGQQYGRQRRSPLRKWAFVAGGGFNAPVGNDTPFITWGGNFTLGGGLRFSEWVSALLEYQFMDNKLPGAFIAAASDANGGGITGGNSRINAITASPVINLSGRQRTGAYLVGGFGYYHKSTNFSAPETVFDPFFGYYSINVTVASFTSNQWGANGGIGFYHRLGGGGGRYGGAVENSPQFFGEARYTYINTPRIGEPNGLGRTELIPVTVGIRF